MKVVLSHDWLTGMRGGERVLELLCEGFPDAPIHTMIHDPSKISPVINRHPVSVSGLQRVPGIFKTYRYFLPFYPRMIERMQPPPADLVLSTSHCIAKGLKPPPGAGHLCYCFTPMRYAWTFYDEYFGRNPLKKAVLHPILARLRDWDRRASERVDRFVAISEHVRERIRTFYGREADVVYPPVDVERCTPGEPGHDGYDLIVSALVPYKRVDLAVQAYNRLRYPLKIVGTGTEYASLRKQAGPGIQFLGWQTDEQIVDWYRRCRFLIFPGQEDFGIVPVEAMACGKPVLAFGKGGVRESVRDGQTGLFFHEQSDTALCETIERASSMSWEASVIRRHAERFGTDRFIDGLSKSIRVCLEDRGGTG